jgi:hypothetical protein
VPPVGAVELLRESRWVQVDSVLDEVSLTGFATVASVLSYMGGLVRNLVTALAVGAVVMFSPHPAVAAPSEPTEIVITQNGESGGSDSNLMLTFEVGDNDPATLKAELEKALQNQQPDQPVSVAATPQDISCLSSTRWWDDNGVYTYQHACGSSTCPWGFKISPTVQAIITSNVAETGMAWTRNGANRPRQAPHNVGKNYQFHGTYNPCQDWDTITYNDHFSFRVNVGGHTGNGVLNIAGNLRNIR